MGQQGYHELLVALSSPIAKSSMDLVESFVMMYFLLRPS
jgi:hypothetical protein